MHSIPRATKAVCSVGQTSWSAADLPVGLPGLSNRPRKRVQEDPRRPGGLPHLLSLLLLALAPLAAQEIKLPPNFGAHASETVDVSLDSNMLQLAAKFLSGAKPDEAQAKKVVTGLKSIYVKSFEFEKAGEYNAADVEAIRAQFRGPGWSRVVGIQSKKDGENAEVFLRLDKDGKIGGLGVVTADPKELTIVSIVGAIDPEQLSELGGKFGVPKIDLERKKKTGKDD